MEIKDAMSAELFGAQILSHLLFGTVLVPPLQDFVQLLFHTLDDGLVHLRTPGK